MAYKQNNNPFLKNSPNKFLGRIVKSSLGGLGRAALGGVGRLFGGRRRGKPQSPSINPSTMEPNSPQIGNVLSNVMGGGSAFDPSNWNNPMTKKRKISKSKKKK